MKKLLFLLLVLSYTAFAQFIPDSRFNGVVVRGKEFIAPDGSFLLLKGINLGNWLVPEGYMFEFSGAESAMQINLVMEQMLGTEGARAFWVTFRDNYITENDIKLIKKIGFNHVRVPFNYRLFVSDSDPSRLLPVGFEMLDRVITWCKAAGLYVLLDMHCAPGGQTGANIDDSHGYPFLFDSEESQQTTIFIWREIARRYANESIVLGYDLLNEPIAHYFDIDRLNQKLEPFYKRLVAEMRTVDTNHIMFLGGAQWNSNFKIFGAPFETKLAYTFHRYWSDTTQSVVQEFVDFSEKYNVPIYLGESGENTFEWIDSFRRLLEKNNIGWCFWPYKKLTKSSCIASIVRPALYDSVRAYADTSRMRYEDIMGKRPSFEVCKTALAEYLKNTKLENCTINPEYIRALGLTVPVLPVKRKE